MKKTLTRLLLAALLLVPLPALAQTSLTSTTLSLAINDSTRQVQVASATGVTAGVYLFMDREAMQVTSISGTVAQVARGVAGTAARAHAASTIVYVGAPERFYKTEVVGTCTATAELYTPRIVLPTGNVYTCQNSVWKMIGADVGSLTVACYTGPLATGSVDQSCFTADRDYVVTQITYVSQVVESGGTLTIIPRRQQGTEAVASGDALATAISGVSTVAQTVTPFTLTTTSADLILDAGDRLGLDFTDDVAGELLGVLVTFTLVPR